MFSTRNAKEGNLRCVVPTWNVLRCAAMAAAALMAGCSLVPADGERLRIDEVERALLPMASVAVDTGQLETAERLYQRLLEASPQSFEAHMGLGDVAFTARRSQEAAGWYLGALAVASVPDQRHEALLWHGRAALEAGLLDDSRRSFQRLTEAGERAPATSVAWAFNGVGLTRLLEGDIRGAVAAMRRAVRHAPNEPMFAENLDRALAMLGEQERRGVPERRAQTVTSSPQPTVAELVPDAPAPVAAPPTPIPTPITPPTAPQPTRTEAEDDSSPIVVWQDDPAPSDDVAPVEDAVPPEDAEPFEDALPVEEIAADTPSPQEQLFVQVGAFDRLADADMAAQELTEATGAEAIVVLSRSLYRVRLGPLAADTAQAARRAATDLGYVVQELGDDAADPDEAEESIAAAEAPSTPDPSSEASRESPPPTAAMGLVVEDAGQWFVQLGAFRTRETARELASRMRDLTTVPVLIDAVERNGETLHRVRVGPLEDEAAFAELADATAILGAGSE